LIHSVGAIQELTKALKQERDEKLELVKQVQTIQEEFNEYKRITDERINKLASLIVNLTK
jgi:uncharacterized protein YcbK (DUF882 family)